MAELLNHLVFGVYPYVCLAVLAVGLISTRLLRLEAMPDITFPGMQVIIPFPGSTPEEMEQLVVRPVEEALATLSGIEEIQATAGSDQAQFTVLFDWDRDANAAAFDVRSKLDSIRAQLPAGADRLLDHHQRQAVAAQFHRINHHLILLHEAADTRHLGHALRLGDLVTQIPVL